MAAKKTATKKAAGGVATKAKAPKASKSPSAELSAKTKPTASKAPAKTPLKLSEAQAKALRQIDSSGESGYVPTQKLELRSIEKLRELKLVKRGAKDKASGAYPYMPTAAGKKHLASDAPA